MQLTAGELNELLTDVADVPGERDGFTLVASVPLDFSLSTAYTARIMGGFSAYRKRGWRKVAQKRNPLPRITAVRTERTAEADAMYLTCSCDF